jgi:hypothetical protein
MPACPKRCRRSWAHRGRSHPRQQARERLRGDGFTDDQIDQWAETFITEVGAGDVDQLVAWISRQER